MRIPVAIFAVLVALCAVVLVLALLEEPADSRGIDHPEYQTMRQGGSTDRHDSILFWGWLYGTLSIVLFVGLMALGLRRGGKLPAGSGPALLAGLVLFAFVFAMLVLSYRAYVAPRRGADVVLVVSPSVGLDALCAVACAGRVRGALHALLRSLGVERRGLGRVRTVGGPLPARP